MARTPTLVIAGTRSGVGKTSFTLALARALTRRGLNVQTFKVGPDFLDPTYLALASGRPCYSLDGWMAGHDHCRRLFARTTADADCALVEGVMGLFDGADAHSNAGSTAEIARLLDAPVILIVNVHGMGRSFAALVKGYTTFQTDLRFTGVVANHCGSKRHAALLSDSLQAAGLPPLLGAIPRGAFPELASRHLGLVTADQGRLPESLLNTLADALEQNLSLETLFPEDESEPTAAAAAIAEQKGAGAPARLRLGVARDAAFHFYYQDLFDALRMSGCEVLFFSPLDDCCLPEGLSGLYLGGGYPELHAERLAKNVEMLTAIRAYADSGRPLYAECGGLMYLSRGIETDGRFYPFAGLLPARTRMLAGKKALGYVEVALTEDSLWGRRGELLRGHEFHYSELIDDPVSDPAWRKVYSLRRRRADTVETEGYQNGAILASYLHLHYASRPAAVARFLERCGGTP
ncbi:MAG: cobyrinic acid a,c-diamide synthase [Syntrophobacterales bacterium CG_4_8_14_3_um_filter_58_8]|nr:MAG: cobyrinic acid a,c-diamide synthase [Syntrophobacterales bacterium CG03_land_8_20_14_0_80_58_14]PJC71841.1 MAG: cobyrinic acid a,c-diamide synthase [Syntrophobacterales bacterium CG_4_8_14_3_um_filter_58_8]